MKLAQYNGYLVNTVGTDGLVLGRSSHSAGCAPMRFQLFMG